MEDLQVDSIVITGDQPLDTSGISSWRMTNVVPKWIELFKSLSYYEETETYRDENNSIVATSKRDFVYANKNYALTVMHDEYRKQSHVSIYTVSVSNDSLSMIGWKTLQCGEILQLDLYTDVDLINHNTLVYSGTAPSINTLMRNQLLDTSSTKAENAVPITHARIIAKIKPEYRTDAEDCLYIVRSVAEDKYVLLDGRNGTGYPINMFDYFVGWHEEDIIDILAWCKK